MRVRTRRVLVDAAVALVLGWVCFWASVRLLGSDLSSAVRALVGRPAAGRTRISPDVEPWVLVAIAGLHGRHRAARQSGRGVRSC